MTNYNALAIDAHSIMRYYKARIEFLFAKQFLVLNHCQAPKALHFHSNASMTALIKLEDRLPHNNTKFISIAS